jgi:hypothetical protein
MHSFHLISKYVDEGPILWKFIVSKFYTFKSSSLKPLNRNQPNLPEMFTGWSYTRFVFLVLIWNPTLGSNVKLSRVMVAILNFRSANDSQFSTGPPNDITSLVLRSSIVRLSIYIYAGLKCTVSKQCNTHPFRCASGMHILLYFISVPLYHMHHNHEWLREYYTYIYVLWIYCICDVMVVALPLTYVGDRVIEPMSNQTKHYQIGICNFSIKGAPLISRVRFIVLNATSKNIIFHLYHGENKLQPMWW